MNFLNGRVGEGRLSVGSTAADAPAHWPAASEEILVGIRPESLALDSEGASGLSFAAVVELLEDLGAETIAYVRPDGAPVAEVSDRPIELQGTLALRLPARVSLRLGERIAVRAELSEAHLFDPVGGDSLLERAA